MILRALFGDQCVILLPATFNRTTMYPFLGEVIEALDSGKCSKVIFDFSRLNFIEPSGIVVLSNAIEFLRKSGLKVSFDQYKVVKPCLKYLDDSQFFQHYLKKPVFQESAVRGTTIPLHLVASQRTNEYVGFQLLPWIAAETGLAEQSVAALAASFQEIFLNINHHSGVDIGCAFAQHYPNENRIKVAISDFGIGIPAKVRTKVPDVADSVSLELAIEEGFTTLSNVRNRGAGLPVLIQQITQINQGTVLIASGKGQLSAVRDGDGTKITARMSQGYYPGTLIELVLRTDTFRLIAEEGELEPFEW